MGWARSILTGCGLSLAAALSLALATCASFHHPETYEAVTFDELDGRTLTATGILRQSPARASSENRCADPAGFILVVRGKTEQTEILYFAEPELADLARSRTGSRVRLTGVRMNKMIPPAPGREIGARGSKAQAQKRLHCTVLRVDSVD